jgi:tetratricopeptide (TPR) repeat protein
MNILQNIILLTSLFLISLGHSAKAQTTTDLAYKAYLYNSEQLWQQAIAQTATEDHWALSQAYYGLLTVSMATKNEALFDETVDKALALLEKLEENNDHKAEAKALRSSVYGFVMGFSPIKGMYYGPKSTNEINEALLLNKESAVVWMVKAGSLYYTPEMFGGDKLAAEKAYEKSIHFFENNGETENTWMYLNALAGLGKTYLANGKKEAAINTYKKALSIEADFNWVAKVLLPKAEKS